MIIRLHCSSWDCFVIGINSSSTNCSRRKNVTFSQGLIPNLLLHLLLGCKTLPAFPERKSNSITGMQECHQEKPAMLSFEIDVFSFDKESVSLKKTKLMRNVVTSETEVMGIPGCKELQIVNIIKYSIWIGV